MVKENKPLQIRMTEPVIFLRGPSTGLDFRGRPQGIDPNAAPAMLRGLLTLRLTKPTRIRSITIRLDGKARTEWPEGIGQRRLDTFEEHVIMHETTTFFDAKRSRSQNNRRANSVPPALYGMSADGTTIVGRSRSSQGRGQRHDSDLDAEDAEYGSALESGLDAFRGRGRDRALPRSASALPGIHDGEHGWHRDGFSRRPSYDADSSRPPSHSDAMPTLGRLNLEDTRGPSPAYTPTAEAPTASFNSSGSAIQGQGPGQGQGGARASRTGRTRESVLSPIQSAVPSRATSERDGSTETQNRRVDSESRSPPPARLDDVEEQPIDGAVTSAGTSAGGTPPSGSDDVQARSPALASASPPPDADSGAASMTREASRAELDEEHGHAIRSILAGSGSGSGASSRAASTRGTPRLRPSLGGEVRFAPADVQGGAGAGPSRLGVNGDYHPAGSAIHAISAVSTAHNSPAPSRPQSIMAAISTEDLTAEEQAAEHVLADMNAPTVSSPLATNFSVPVESAEAAVPDAPLGRVSSESTHSTHSRRSNLSTRSNRSILSLRSAAAAGAAATTQSSAGGASSTSRRGSFTRNGASASASGSASASATPGNQTPTGTGISAASSTTSLQEVRQGRKNRLGSHSTIVTNTDPNVAPLPPIEAISSNPNLHSPRHTAAASGNSTGRSSLGPPAAGGGSGAVQRGVSPYGQPQGFGDGGNSSSGAEDRGRKGTSSTSGGGGGRFSLAATLRGLSKDVKERVRASSRSKSRAGFGSGHGSTADLSNYPGPPGSGSGGISASNPSMRGRGAVPVPGGGRAASQSHSRSRSTTRHNSGSGDGLLPPPMPSRIERSPSNLGQGAPQPDRVRAMRTGSFTRQDPDFVPPFGRGGAGRVNSASRERERDRERERSSSRRATSRTDSPGPASASMGRIKEEEGNKKGKRSESRGRGRHMGMKILTDALGLGDHGEAQEGGVAKGGKEEGEGYRDEHGDVHNWKEFRKGTYNYPISFPIPLTAPPTIHAEFGSVVYRLKATVVRVGALTANLAEEMEVTMIATPQEDDLEETENVIVERQWEEQMRYQIALSGKAFPIGGNIPISIRLMPLAKCKVHRLSMCLEEKTDYYAQGKKVVRHETPRRYMMLFVKQPEKKERIEPLLPILSTEVDAARQSPLAELAKNAALSNPSTYTNFAGELDDDALYATLMDPSGPWHLETSLQIPDCAQRVRFSSKHDKTNISISHWLKVTIRVERGDDEALDAKGRRKLFDIIIETPIKILDCRVNPQWNSLPTYTTFNPSSTAVLTGLCSIHGTKHKAATATGPGSSAINGTAAGPSANGSYISRPGSAVNLNGHASSSGISDLLPPNLSIAHTGISSVQGSSAGLQALAQASGSGTRRREEGDDTLLERNIVYDRLMSGQETEEGDVPPSYQAAALAGAVEGISGGLGSGSNSRRGSAAALAPAEYGSGRRDESPGATPRGRPTLLRGESEDDGAVVMGSTSSSRSRESRERRGRAGQVAGEAGDRGRSKSRLRSEVI